MLSLILAAHIVVVVAVAFGISICSILKGSYVPQRATWFGWLIVDMVLSYSSYQFGGWRDPTFIIAVPYMIGAFIVLVLSFKYGKGGHSLFDRLCFLMGASGGILSYFFGQSGIAIILASSALWVSAIPNFAAAWEKPHEEEPILWWLFLLATDYSLFRVDDWHKWESWLFPASDMIFMFAMLGTIYLAHWRIRRKAKKEEER